MKKFLGYGLLIIVAVLFLLVAFYFLVPETLFKLAIDASQRYAGLSKKEVQVDDHRIAYLEGGKGETIVLLHGFGGNKDVWTVFDIYLKGCHLVIPDIPGFGDSSKVPTDHYDVESQVERIARFVDVLKLDKFHMAGNSLGGAYTATYGAKHPGRVLTLALLDTAGAPPPKKNEFFMQLERGHNLLLASNNEEFSKLMALLFVIQPKAPASFMKIIAAGWIAHTEFNKKIWNDSQPLQLTLEPVLPLIQAPVLIIWGEQDKLTDVGGVPFLEKNLKNYRTVIMKDTGHAPMIEKPEETAKAYMSFLTEKRYRLLESIS